MAAPYFKPAPHYGLPFVVYLAVLIAFAGLALVIALELATLSRKFLFVFVVVSCAGILSIWLRDVVSLLLVGAVLVISYNRHYYSFDDWIGDYGAAGLYWTPVDPVFVLIALVAGAGALVRRTNSQMGPPGGIEGPLLIFIGTLALSSLFAAEFVPAAVETFRFIKLLLILLLLRALMDARGRLAILVGLGLMVFLQTGLSMVQVALGAGESGLSNLEGGGGEMAHRATGTLGHPAFLSPFFLTFVPGFLAMILARAPLFPRLLGFSVGIAGLLTMVLTQSRAPLAALIVFAAGFAFVLMSRGQVRPRKLIGIGVLSVTLVMCMALPISDKIIERLIGDADASISFRIEYNDAAFAMWRSAPFVGVGPNHFVPSLEEHAPRIFAINEELAKYRLEANARSAAPVHNSFFLVLSETGLLGLLAWLLFLGSLLRLFWRTGDHGRDTLEGLFCHGTFWGFLALLAEQTTDFSMWWDHHMTLLIVLGAFATGLSRDQRAGRA